MPRARKPEGRDRLCNISLSGLGGKRRKKEKSWGAEARQPSQGKEREQREPNNVPDLAYASAVAVGERKKKERMDGGRGSGALLERKSSTSPRTKRRIMRERKKKKENPAFPLSAMGEGEEKKN